MRAKTMTKSTRKILAGYCFWSVSIVAVWAVLSLSSNFAKAAFAGPKDCESLAQLTLANTKIITAQSVTTGEFTPPGRTASIKGLPPFCRVAATLTPSADSDIKIEVWLPLSGWNGKYRGQGNGGVCGGLSFHAVGGGGNTRDEHGRSE